MKRNLLFSPVHPKMVLYKKVHLDQRPAHPPTPKDRRPQGDQSDQPPAQPSTPGDRPQQDRQTKHLSNVQRPKSVLHMKVHKTNHPTGSVRLKVVFHKKVHHATSLLSLIGSWSFRLLPGTDLRAFWRYLFQQEASRCQHLPHDVLTLSILSRSL